MTDSLPTARDLLLRLRVTDDPVWSSYLLERTLAQILAPADARVGDLLHVLWDLLAETRAALGRPMSYFLRDIVVLCFNIHRDHYSQADLEWMVPGANAGCTAAQAYLALHALSDDHARRCRDALLAALDGTEFRTEAQQILA
jgi:hypothetical protein